MPKQRTGITETRTRSENMGPASAAKPADRLTATEVVQAFQRQLKGQQTLVNHGLGVRQKLSQLAVQMRELLDDHNFVKLLRAEKLDNIPTELFCRTQLFGAPPMVGNK